MTYLIYVIVTAMCYQLQLINIRINKHSTLIERKRYWLVLQLFYLYTLDLFF